MKKTNIFIISLLLIGLLGIYLTISLSETITEECRDSIGGKMLGTECVYQKAPPISYFILAFVFIYGVLGIYFTS